MTIYALLSNFWISRFTRSFAPPRGFSPSPRPAPRIFVLAPPRRNMVRPAHPWSTDKSYCPPSSNIGQSDSILTPLYFYCCKYLHPCKNLHFCSTYFVHLHTPLQVLSRLKVLTRLQLLTPLQVLTQLQVFTSLQVFTPC